MTIKAASAASVSSQEYRMFHRDDTEKCHQMMDGSFSLFFDCLEHLCVWGGSEYIRCTVSKYLLAVSQCLGRGIACVSATLMHSAEHVGGLLAAAEVLLLCRADRAACVLK